MMLVNMCIVLELSQTKVVSKTGVFPNQLIQLTSVIITPPEV